MKKLSKKFMLGITAGVLAVLVIIGAGTFAWFTSSTSIEEAEFTTAIVELSEAEGEYGVYNFLTGHELNIEYQTLLEEADEAFFAAWLGSINPGNQLMKDDYDAANFDLDELLVEIQGKQTEVETAKGELKDALDKYNELYGIITNPQFPNEPQRSDYRNGWLGDIQYGIAYAQYILEWGPFINKYLDALGDIPEAYLDKEKKDAIQKELEDALVKLQEKEQELMDIITKYAVFESANADRVTPGALIYGVYDITNASNVGTYFRLTETSAKTDIAMVKAIAFNGTYAYELELYQDSSGVAYYYSPCVLPAGENIKIIIGAYVFGKANENDVQNTPFGFDGLEVQLIQHTNNAVYLHDGWKDAANSDDVNFKPYTEPVQP